ncbi:myeloid differentiation primary response protein MyD88-A-like [Anopheles ziemanni]|uniref:myeloid differentiation primary response protein MyD88-A-like n=1 Tax=Anopheles coustani TaxID=139045 RepID=UPI002659D288|nr:myeloid differentiation primary response protein MyD88-A-like [Anopheles coustani]XP_058177782.1 myeloid differentiation primary response protein MyD88-A-like [Anopheles ziemanni]
MLDNSAKVTEAHVGSRNDLTMVPLKALSPLTRDLLGCLLDKERIFLSEAGFSRDWRGLFNLVEIPKSLYPLVKGHEKHTHFLLELWEKESHQCKVDANLAQLQNLLGCIDRWDVVDDTFELFEKDAEKFLLQEHRRTARESEPAELQDDCVPDDNDIIVVGDRARYKQQFDAFILFAQEDIDFATKMVSRLEDRGLKLCLKDRDILAGASFEHEVMSRLISERCRRLVVIISEAFLASSLNDFTVTFAQALQIERRQRKVIPCVYEKCDLPPHLKYTCRLDYQRSQNLYNFWDKLANSIRPSSAAVSIKASPVKEDPEDQAPPKAQPIAVTAPLPIAKLAVDDDEPTLIVKLPNTAEQEGCSYSLQKSHSFWDLFSGLSQKKNRLYSSSSQVNINDITPSPSPNQTSYSLLSFIKRDSPKPNGNAASSVLSNASPGREKKQPKPKKKWYKSMGRKVAPAT